MGTKNALETAAAVARRLDVKSPCSVSIVMIAIRGVFAMNRLHDADHPAPKLDASAIRCVAPTVAVSSLRIATTMWTVSVTASVSVGVSVPIIVMTPIEHVLDFGNALPMDYACSPTGVLVTKIAMTAIYVSMINVFSAVPTEPAQVRRRAMMRPVVARRQTHAGKI